MSSLSSFLNETSSFIKGQLDGQKYAKKYLNNISDYLSNIGSDVRIQGNTAIVGYQIMQNQANDRNSRSDISFIDMKPYFKNSPKAKRKKDGGWYLTIPIGNNTTQLRSAYSRKIWDNISHMQFGETFDGGADLKRVQKGLGTSQWGVNQGLKYKWKSTNVTRVQWGSSGRRANYISFRTVSSSSPATSWIVGRRNFTTKVVSNQYANQIADIIKNHVSL